MSHDFDVAEPAANTDRRLPAIAKRVSRPARATIFTLPNGEVIPGYFTARATTTDDTPTAVTLDLSDETSLLLKDNDVMLFTVRTIGVQSDGAIAAEGSGTAVSATANTIVIAASAQIDDFYNDGIITITGGTGAGQQRLISDWVEATDTITVSEDWTTIPDATSTYEIKLFIGDAIVNVQTGGISRGLFPSDTGLIGANTVVHNTSDVDLTATVAITADNADGSLVVTVTGEVGKTIDWDVEIDLQRLPFTPAPIA